MQLALLARSEYSGAQIASLMCRCCCSHLLVLAKLSRTHVGDVGRRGPRHLTWLCRGASGPLPRVPRMSLRCVAACLCTSYVVIGCAVLACLIGIALAVRKRRGALQAQGVRIIDAAGGLSYAGLAQVRTDSGFGSICGMNQAAADVVCKQLGYGSGVASDSPCGSYGGSNICGAPGSPVVMQSLTCTGAELAVTECEWSLPDTSCSSHISDAVVFCTGGTMEPQVRIICAIGGFLACSCALFASRGARCAC